MGHPSPSGHPEPVDERRGSVQGLISAGIVIGIFALWAGSASVLSWWATSTRPGVVALWISFTIGTVFESILLLTVFLKARTLRRATIATVLAGTFFVANRIITFSLVSNTEYSSLDLYRHSDAEFVGPIALFVFLVGLLVGWTAARYRSLGAWFGLGVALLLAAGLSAGSYFYQVPQLLVVATGDDRYFPAVGGAALLLIIGICLGVVTLSDTIGVAMRPTPVPAFGYPVQLSPYFYPMPMAYPPSAHSPPAHPPPAHPPNPGVPFAQHPQSPTMSRPNATESTAP